VSLGDRRPPVFLKEPQNEFNSRHSFEGSFLASVHGNAKDLMGKEKSQFNQRFSVNGIAIGERAC
jgi:hypothetical protein